MKTKLPLAAVLLCLVATVSLAFALEPGDFVDPFAPGQCVASNPALCTGRAGRGFDFRANASSPFFLDESILGGERDVELTPLGLPSHMVRFVEGRYLLYANGAAARSTALLTWDGADGDVALDATGLDHQDLSALCQNGQWQIRFAQIFLDLSARYRLRIYTDSTNYSEWESAITYGENYSQPVSADFGLGPQDFSPVAGSGANYADVGAITLLLDGSLEDAVDLTLWPPVVDCQLPTAVGLVSFSAARQQDGVTMAWETATEIDNLGFHLYRALKAVDGPVVPERINAGLIPSQVPPGSPLGATYTWLDGEAQPGQAYYYWLEDVDARGTTTLHGPLLVPSQ